MPSQSARSGRAGSGKPRPYIVVHDRPDQIALDMPQGSPTKTPPGSGIPRDEWTLEDGEFRHEALRLTHPGAAHAVLLFWDAGGFVGWYVNFERPLTRSHVGFDYLTWSSTFGCGRTGESRRSTRTSSTRRSGSA